MSMMPVEPILALALIASSPMPIIRVDDASPISCLSSEETRDAVAEGRVMQPAEASRHARHAAPGEVVRIRLCRQGDDFVYVVTTLKRDGRVARVTLEGQSGKIATIR
uniref:PepSY domain-containing protein n=1 Tax=Bosea sp. NBC_00436 TaxID=2969620 RepID=A0A9E7ZPH6_9HYPH